jgi:hypothetical protein
MYPFSYLIIRHFHEQRDILVEKLINAEIQFVLVVPE